MSGPLDPVALLRALATAGVEHVVIGGFAVMSHGVVRGTKVLDICPAPQPANLARLARCLSELEVVQLGVGDVAEHEMPVDPTRAEDLAQGANFRLDSSLGALDIMQWISGIDAEQAYAVLAPEAVEADIEGVRVRICSLAHLRAMKRAAGRPQDLQDLADLAAAHGEPPA